MRRYSYKADQKIQHEPGISLTPRRGPTDDAWTSRNRPKEGDSGKSCRCRVRANRQRLSPRAWHKHETHDDFFKKQAGRRRRRRPITRSFRSKTCLDHQEESHSPPQQGLAHPHQICTLRSRLEPPATTPLAAHKTKRWSHHRYRGASRKANHEVRLLGPPSRQPCP